MKILFDGIPMDEVSTSTTINAPAALLLLMYEIAAEEQGVDADQLRGTIQNDARSVDPLAGSYLVESMTDRVEAEVLAELDTIDDLGGAVAAIEVGYQKREIEQSAYDIARAVESGEQVVVGVNRFQMDDDVQPNLQRVDEAIRDQQVARIDGRANATSQRSTPAWTRSGRLRPETKTCSSRYVRLWWRG